MGFRVVLRWLFRGCFSDMEMDSDQEKQKKHSRGIKRPLEKCYRKIRTSRSYSDRARSPQQGPYYYKSQAHSQSQSQEDDHASGGQKRFHGVNRPDLAKPLPVVPRQCPPQQKSPYRALSPLQKRNSHVQAQQLTSASDEFLRPLTDRSGSTEAIIILEDRSMNYEAVCEVIDMIALRFSHIPYAVSGLAAMVYYGYDARPYKVSIICPEHTRENQKCWAKALGMLQMPKRQDIWGVATRDGMLRQIRVRFPYDFEQMHTLRVGSSGVSMLSLAGLADELARTYVNELKHSDQDRQENLAKEMVWILNRIIQVKMPEHRLKPERIPHLINERFWLPFSLAYPEVVPLFAKAGWRIPIEGWSA
ncbi:uncharacterized protein B0J16DRAFT_326316 [Fusarium flagelliforme]|uniref:uncharacterized protein n=1 Tax=Fusarium flagelliforme TaxID=2675880 RepID=UPI001E8D900B|nr:uncharacterized protein B0J16DRAFT_326316 [Fusarium flagelliforme]KAH7196634.1 hypothetical protein B0J16DRAFT_326316 [Fusarium flagelliforme]